MATIETKYSVGDVVYYASTTTESKKHDCPDCKGLRKWKAISPAGKEYTFECPRCSASYNSDRDLVLDYSAYTPVVQRRTIGSIQVNTAKDSYGAGNSYMCIETGVGSGSVYREAQLFASESEAMAAAQEMAASQNNTTDWVVTLYNKTLKISVYQLDNAKLKLASEAQARARSMIWNLGDLFSQIENASTKDEILEAVQEYRDYDWSRDKAKAEEESEAAIRRSERGGRLGNKRMDVQRLWLDT